MEGQGLPRAGSGSRRRVRRRLVVRVVDISAPGAHLPLAADERPDACHVADVRARTRSGHLLLGLKNARREEREAQADAGKPTRDSHERVRRATQSEPRGDEVRTHRRDRATTGAELRTLTGTASFIIPDFDAAGCRFGNRSRCSRRKQDNPAPRHPRPRQFSQGSQSGFFHPNSPVKRFREENLTFCRVTVCRRGDRWTPQRVARRHLDARVEPPERSGASRPNRSSSRYARTSFRERLESSSRTCRGRERLVSEGGKNAGRLASSCVGGREVSNCRDDGEKQKIRSGEGERARLRACHRPARARAYPRFPARRGNANDSASSSAGPSSDSSRDVFDAFLATS